MILSERELELGDDHSGIMVLADGLEPGTPLADVLPLAGDRARDRDRLQPPRPASVYGIAREVAALSGVELAPPPGVRPRAAGRRAGRRAHRGSRGLPALRRPALPRRRASGRRRAWLQARLLAAGMRPISNVVDVTNYVMLALGSPLHVFDLSTLAEGRIVVRRARRGRGDHDARRRRAQARAVRPRDRRRRAAGRDRRDHGRRGQRGTDRDDRRAARGRELRRRSRSCGPRERLRLRSEASTRWEKGVDPYLGRAGGRLRERAARRARRRAPAPAPTDVQRRPARAAGRPAAARARRPRSSGSTFPVERAARDAASGSGSRSPDDRVTVPDLARARRDAARSISSRRSAASGSRRFRSTLPARTRDVRPADAGAAATPPRRGRARRAPASPRPTPGASCRPREGATRARRAVSPSSMAALRTDLRSACSSRRSGTGTPATRRSRCSRSAASTCRPASELPEEQLARRRHHRGRLRPAKGAVESLHDALASRSRFEREPR